MTASRKKWEAINIESDTGRRISEPYDQKSYGYCSDVSLENSRFEATLTIKRNQTDKDKNIVIKYEGVKNAARSQLYLALNYTKNFGENRFFSFKCYESLHGNHRAYEFYVCQNYDWEQANLQIFLKVLNQFDSIEEILPEINNFIGLENNRPIVSKTFTNKDNIRLWAPIENKLQQNQPEVDNTNTKLTIG